MVTLKHFFLNGEHNFLLETGKKTGLGTRAGVWASYRPPQDNNPGEVMMLYATKESRHYVAHVLGALAVHSVNTYNNLPVGSHNLSPHSIVIQRRLSKILGQKQAESVMNRENWFKSIEYVKAMAQVNHVRVDNLTYDIELGKQIMLDILKRE